MLVIDSPKHLVWLSVPVAELRLTTGFGLTVMVKVVGVPVQLLAVAVTETVLFIDVLPELAAVKPGMFPVPVVLLKPTAVLLLLQANVAPVGVEVRLIAVLASPVHKVLSVMALTVGLGLAFTMT